MCRGLIGRVLGHYFEPRHDTYPARTSGHTVTVYVCDVCRRCGCRTHRPRITHKRPLPPRSTLDQPR